jgi:capsular exopolysaccharide synthesis family protein
MERATPNLNSSSPGLVKFSVMGLVLGLALSIGVALFLNSCENTLKNSTDIKRHFQYPALGAVPRWDKEAKYIDEMVPDSSLAEVYGILRNNVRFSNFSNPEKCLLVASPSQQEGKSLMAINLALSFALEGNSALLISADLRRPFSHTLFRKKEDIKKKLGITEYLDESASLEEVTYDSHFSNFSFIPTCARASNPTKLLKSSRFKEMLNYAEKNYDVVIIDSPAILPVVDATLISPMVKGVLMVAKAGQSTTNSIQDALTRLEHVRSPIMGISLNMIKDLKLEIFYGYGQNQDSGYHA